MRMSTFIRNNMFSPAIVRHLLNSDYLLMRYWRKAVSWLLFEKFDYPHLIPLKNHVVDSLQLLIFSCFLFDGGSTITTLMLPDSECLSSLRMYKSLKLSPTLLLQQRSYSSLIFRGQVPHSLCLLSIFFSLHLAGPSH